MSSKKTIVISRIDNIIFWLKKINKPFKLSLIGNIQVSSAETEKNHKYMIRRLDYDDVVVLEQFIHIKDADLDDLLISKAFPKDAVPKTWKYKKIIK